MIDLQTVNSFDQYQEWTRKTIAYPKDKALDYLHPAISEEVGELNGKRAKAIRKNQEPNRGAIALELGDILWNVARIADEYDYSLREIVFLNMDKLSDRMERNTIVGEGDYR